MFVGPLCIIPPQLSTGPCEGTAPVASKAVFAGRQADLRGTHLSNTTCLAHAFLQQLRQMQQTMMTLDTNNNTENKRGRIRQVALDK